MPFRISRSLAFLILHPTMSASPSPYPLASVVKYGKTLANLLGMAKSKAQSTHPTNINIDERVTKVIMELLGVFNREQGSASLPKESLARFLKKIEEFLEEFIKADPAGKGNYQILASKVNDCKLRRDQYSAPAFSLSPASTDLHRQPSTFNYSQDDFEDAYDGLEEQEKRCLLCFAFFPADVDIKKRELIHCWIGIELISETDPTAGDRMLAKLVLEGLIERVIEKKRFSSRYIMHQSVHSKLMHHSTDALEHSNQCGSWSVMHKPITGVPGTDPFVRSHTLYVLGPQSNLNNIEALVNIRQTALNTKRFQSVSQMRNLKVLHLGNWKHDPRNYIVAEGLGALRTSRLVRSLSLQGVSGIEKLPDSVYRRLDNLRILDLRACHNFKSISAVGIISLTSLRHLDLSECYLLDHIPKTITSLTGLQVLKGFVINSLPQIRNPESSQPCAFSDLSKLEQLVKLTVRTRRMCFPTAEDLQTLCQLANLRSLRIAWVGSSNDCQAYESIGSMFPKTLKKLEMQAAAEGTASRLLALISAAENNRLEKLYIRGGGLSELSSQKHQLQNIKELRLRYLTELHVPWNQFRKSFSGLRYLEIFGCPNLVFFPCNSSGVWESRKG